MPFSIWDVCAKIKKYCTPGEFDIFSILEYGYFYHKNSAYNMGTEMMARIKNLTLMTLIKQVYWIKRIKTVEWKK